MLQLNPQAIRIVDSYDDGLDAKHFTFEAIDFEHQPVNIGQFFMLSVPGAGLAPFTYTSLPDTDGHFNVLIRKVGKLTGALFQLSNGAVLGYNGPLGVGWPMDVLQNKEVLIVSGGCGLAPVAACINYLIDNQQADNTTVVYGAGSADAQVLSTERAYWKSKLLVYETLLDSTDAEYAGTPTEHLAQLLAKHHKSPEIVLCCGPEAMMQSVVETCIGLGLKEQQIYLSLERRMRCGVGLCGHCYLGDNLVCTQGPTYRYDKYVSLQQKTTQFPAHQGLFNYC
jgi:anaerobic sulfite reductase subunit B